MTGAPERTLVLIRHAKAEPAGMSAPDEARALALRGRAQAAQLGRDLVALGAVPGLVLCSSALRTRQTWEIMNGALRDATGGSAAPSVHVSDELYSATPQLVLSLVREYAAGSGTVVVVGHEPIISMTADLLADATSDRSAAAQVSVGVPTAAACILRSSAPWADWGRGSATLAAVHRPVVT